MFRLVLVQRRRKSLRGCNWSYTVRRIRLCFDYFPHKNRSKSVFCHYFNLISNFKPSLVSWKAYTKKNFYLIHIQFVCYTLKKEETTFLKILSTCFAFSIIFLKYFYVIYKGYTFIKFKKILIESWKWSKLILEHKTTWIEQSFKT